jgi:hypothetical protein
LELEEYFEISMVNCALLDTNILMYIYLNRVDVVGLLEMHGFRIIIPSKIVDELEKLESVSKSKEKIAARFALELVKKKCEVVEIEATDGDAALLLAAEKHGCLLVTSDKMLIKKAKSRGIETADLREMRKLEFSSQ